MKFKHYLESRLNSMLLQLGPDNREFILKIHRELFKGVPLNKEEYYKLTNLSKEKADAILEKLGELDAQGNIIAFSGLSLIPTNHRIVINGKKLYTWCAIDAIFFTEWLDVASQIFSEDPIDKTPVELQIEGDHLLWTKPYPLFISWVETIDACDIRGSLCNHVSFFASEKTAKQWLENNPDGKILTIDDFFESTKIGIQCC